MNPEINAIPFSELKTLLSEIATSLSHGSSDPLSREIGIVSAKQYLRLPLLLDSYRLSPDTGLSSQCRIWSKSQSRDYERLSRLERMRQAQSDFSLACQAILAEDFGPSSTDNLGLFASSLGVLSPLPESNFLRRGQSYKGLSDEQLENIQKVQQRIGQQRQQANTLPFEQSLYLTFEHFCQYYLWRNGKSEELPELGELPLSGDLYNLLPSELKDFHVNVLHQTWLELFQSTDSSQPKPADRLSDLVRFQTQRMITASLAPDLSNARMNYPDNYITRWRREFRKAAAELGISLKTTDRDGQPVPELTLPTWETTLDYIGKRLLERMATKNARTIVMGISGDLDSAAMLALLAESIRKNHLPCTIEVFYLKKDDHPPRFRRIEQLINYLNRDSAQETRNESIVNLHVFDLSLAYELLLHALVSKSDKFSPSTVEYVKQAISIITQAAKFAAGKDDKIGYSASRRQRKRYGLDKESDSVGDLAQALTRQMGKNDLVELVRQLGHQDSEEILAIPSNQLIHFIASLMSDYRDVFQKIKVGIDPREESNLIHELLITLRGYMCRHCDGHVSISGENFTELAIENFTTSDTLVDWYPLGHLPKTLVASIFREYIYDIREIDEKEWEKKPLNSLVPYYPSGIYFSNGNGGFMTIYRDPYFVSEFTQVLIDPATSAIPAEVWTNMKEFSNRSIRLEGNIQWYIDPYLYYFMIHGLSQQTVDYLCSQYPSRKTDVQLAAFLMAAARERRQKDVRAHLPTIGRIF